MKKKLLVLLLAVMCLSLLTGCFCQHEWKAATCTDPSTCAKCEKTEGEALGHVWMAATCETPKTCEVCGTTDGEPKGHTWVDADCENPRTCSACKLTEGEALGHDWQEATTELPKTCAVCAATEGERIITDPRFTTAQTAAIQGKWGFDMPMTGADMGLADFNGVMECQIQITFANDGKLNFGMVITNEDAFMAAMAEYTMASTYAELAAQGMNKEAAEAAVMENYGMSMEDYIAAYLETVDFNSMFDGIFSALNGVYYMEDGLLYTGMSWDLMTEDPCTLEGDTLVIDSFSEEMGVDATFKRIEE